MNISPQRNRTVDILRGIAILFVVLGHTMTSVTEGAEDSFLFNVVWTLQMPLFFLISGYVTRYSKDVTNFGSFARKKTLAYLLPFGVWTLVIRGLLLGQTEYLKPGFLLYNMDSGYWFLFSLWVIVMIYGLSAFFSERLCKNKGKITKLAVFTAFYLAGMVLLGLVGLKMGLSFLCIKLTLYYMPFFYLGLVFGRLGADLCKRSWLVDGVAVLCFALWVALMLRCNFYSIADSAKGILLRACASVAGCVAVCVTVSRIFARKEGKLGRFFSKIGGKSLEIYLSHYLFLSMLKLQPLPEFSSVAGVLLTALNFAVTLVVAYVLTALMGSIDLLNLVCFGKRKRAEAKP